jgi:hypothetical protein
VIQGVTPLDNAGYYHAAYAAALTIYALYAVSLWRRRRALRDRHAARGTRDHGTGHGARGTSEGVGGNASA